MTTRILSIYAILLGVTGFTVLVLYLHTVQVGYNPKLQLMSELAQGTHGFLMLFAFFSIAFAVVGAQGVLGSYDAPILVRLILGIASLSFAGAGIFELHSATILHVVLIALAFILVGLVMYLTPVYTKQMQDLNCKVISWGLGSLAVVFTALGSGPLPIGIAQRLVAATVILWMLWLSLREIGKKDSQRAQHEA